MKKTAAILASMALCTGFAADAGAEEAIVRLDKKGTLTLCAGDVNYDDVRHFADDSRVKRVVCEDGAVLPEDCEQLFREYRAKEIDLSKADASAVTDMRMMFYDCENLVTVDMSCLTGGTDMVEEMFEECPKLTTVYVYDKWKRVPDTYHTTWTWEGMFDGCDKLVGGNGSKYSELGDDTIYARIDTEDHPGYFTEKKPEINAESITVKGGRDICADKHESIRLTASISPKNVSADTVVWTSSDPYTASVDENGKVTALQKGSVVITATATNGTADTSDDKTATCKITVTSDGSVGRTHLDEKTGVLTLSGNVTREQILAYRYDTRVTKITAEKGTVLPEDCSGMFSRYDEYGDPVDGGETEGPFWTGVTSVDFSGADSSNVVYMDGMFFCGYKMTTIDISGFELKKTENISFMFYGCDKLTAVYVSDKWDASKVTDQYHVFVDCDKLKGGKGTKFSDDYVDGDYARIDSKGAPGYFTKKLSEKIRLRK